MSFSVNGVRVNINLPGAGCDCAACRARGWYRDPQAQADESNSMWKMKEDAKKERKEKRVLKEQKEALERAEHARSELEKLRVTEEKHKKVEGEKEVNAAKGQERLSVLERVTSLVDTIKALIVALKANKGVYVCNVLFDNIEK